MKTTLETRKINLIKIISDLDDDFRIQEIENLLNKNIDWWQTIDEEEKAEIDNAILQADLGQTISHNEFIDRYKKWL